MKEKHVCKDIDIHDAVPVLAKRGGGIQVKQPVSVLCVHIDFLPLAEVSERPASPA